MKQKILYIIVMITALVGGKGEVWGQSEVDGYTYKTTDAYTCSETLSNTTEFTDNTIYLRDKRNINNYEIESVFTLGNNVRTWIGGSGYENYSHNENTVRWGITDTTIPCYITLKGFATTIYATTVLSSRKVIFTSSNGLSTELSIPAYGTETKDILWSLSDNHTINISFSGNATAIYYYKYLSYTYTLSYYELITTAIDDAKTYASDKSSLIDETLRGYLTTAINNAKTFIGDCAFPNSYWNGSPEGKSPADVTEEAAKLKAIADYLVVRTNASVYKKDEIPDEVYRQLHQYDQYDPNDFDSETINIAKADIEKAIGYAQNTNEPYISAKSDIATAAARTDHNDADALAKDVADANAALETATDVDAINAALDNIKNFDNITFNGPFSVDEGVTIDNPANATSGNGVAYSSSDETIVSISGTTLKALKPGTVTITASTSTSEVYYGYTETKEYTIKAKPLVLEPTEKCSVNLDVEYPTVTLNRTFTIGHSTLALPFDTDISDLSESPEAYAAQLSLVTYNQADGYTLYFKIVEGGAMVANQPYVIYLPSTKNSFSWFNVTINSVTPLAKAEGENERFQGWTMQANYTPGFPMVGNYGIVGGKFCLGIGDSKINAYTAYFIPPTTQNVWTRVAILDEWGNATFIGEVKDGVLQTEEGIFGLDGVRQNELRKGINIVKIKDGTVRKVLK